MTLERTRKGTPRFYLSLLFATSLLMAITIVGLVVLIVHVEPCRIPPTLGLGGFSIMGLVGAIGTFVNLVRLARALRGSGQAGNQPDLGVNSAP
jgi:hypothetical protein